MTRARRPASHLGRPRWCALRRWLLPCVGLLALAAGCARAEDDSGAAPSTITVLFPDDESAIVGDTPRFLVFLPLVALNEEGELEGRLARSWEHSPDFRTWTVHLRTDVRWHDGVPVTAHDVKFTLDLLSHPDVPGIVQEPPGAYSVTVLDDSTYTITYQRRAAGSPLDYWTVYYPKHLLEGLDPKKWGSWEFWKHPVGNGPYRFVRYVPKTAMVFAANPDYYWGKPKIERVVLKFAERPLLTELLSGNVDALMYVNPMDLLKLKGDPLFRAYYYTGWGQLTALYWNQRHPAFRDARVRRALTLAIDRRELHRLLNLPEETPIFDVIFTERQLNQAELPPPFPYDPEQARRLLDEAGWRDTDGDGIRDRAGRPFRFALKVSVAGWTPGTSREQTAVYVQEQLRRVGIRMEILTVDALVGRELWRKGDFDAAIVTNLAGEYMHLSNYSEDSPFGYFNPKVHELVQRASVSLNTEEIDGIYRSLWPIFQAEVPMTPLYPALWTNVVHRRIRGLSTPFRADPLRHMDELWIEEEP